MLIDYSKKQVTIAIKGIKEPLRFKGEVWDIKATPTEKDEEADAIAPKYQVRKGLYIVDLDALKVLLQSIFPEFIF